MRLSAGSVTTVWLSHGKEARAWEEGVGRPGDALWARRLQNVVITSVALESERSSQPDSATDYRAPLGNLWAANHCSRTCKVGTAPAFTLAVVSIK